MDGTTTNGAQKSAQFFVGQSGPSLWRNGMEVANPLTDGLSAFRSSLLLSHPRLLFNSYGLRSHPKTH